MKPRTLEVLQATFIATLAEGVAVTLFCGMLAVWIMVGATGEEKTRHNAGHEIRISFSN